MLNKKQWGIQILILIYAVYYLTHLPLMPHIYVSVNEVSIGSDNGSVPIRRQSIIWTSIGLRRNTNISEIVIKIRIFHSSKNAFEQVIDEMAAILSRGRWVKQVILGFIALYISIYLCCKP